MRVLFGLTLAAVLLAGCESKDAEQDRRLATAELNLRRAAAASSQLVDRVERLERRVDELEIRADDAENERP